MKKIWPFLTLVPLIFMGTYWVLPDSPKDKIIKQAGEQREIRADQGMEEAVTRLLSSLNPQQTKAVQFTFDDDERVNWNFVPIARQGLVLKELNQSQRDLVNDILVTAMSSEGMVRVEGIMELEEVLRVLEGLPENSTRRDPEKYYLSVFGGPGKDEPWGWRYEGHHLSLNFTSVGDKLVSATPSFMGSNPASVLEGPKKGWSVLSKEEEMGRSLVTSLDAQQRSKAIFSSTAPNEIITASERHAVIKDVSGIKYSELNPAQQQMVLSLIDLYLGRFQASIRTDQMATLKSQGLDDIRFAWAGSLKSREGHYYRIHTGGFLIEYDNTQNDANHVHTVWRGFGQDFGEDPLARHYKKSH